MSPDTERPGARGPALGVTVIGCGAATRLYAAPALAAIEGRGLLRVTRLFDPAPDAVAAVRPLLASAMPAPSLEAALEGADLAVIASPPALHASQCAIALKSGLHVFCEKPLALAAADAQALIATAEACGRLLAVGLIRRHLPAARAIKALLAAGTLGTPRSVCWFEGGPFDWPVAGPGYFSAAQSGGGILQDIGTHALDLLAWWLGPPQLRDYADDAMGGVEANASLHLACGAAEVRMRLSRDWARPNRVTIRGARGTIRWDANAPLSFELGLDGAPPGLVTLDDGAGGTTDFVSTYAVQIADAIDAIRSGRAPAVPAAAGRDACALIETCYRERRLLEMGWFSEQERAQAAAHAGGAR